MATGLIAHLRKFLQLRKCRACRRMIAAKICPHCGDGSQRPQRETLADRINPGFEDGGT